MLWRLQPIHAQKVPSDDAELTEAGKRFQSVMVNAQMCEQWFGQTAFQYAVGFSCLVNVVGHSGAIIEC